VVSTSRTRRGQTCPARPSLPLPYAHLPIHLARTYMRHMYALCSHTHTHTPLLPSLKCLQLGHAYDAKNREVPLGGQHKQDAVKSAKTALELYRTIG
jgi:hypothetical protein